MSVVDIKYNTNDLQTSSNVAKTIITKDILEKHIGEKVINLKQDTIRDGFDVLDVQYANKIIALEGWLISNTASALRTWVDEFNGYLQPNEKNLDVETYGGSGAYRRYVCSCRSLSIPEEHWQTTQVPYSCEFLCEPFGKATSTISETLGTNKTDSWTADAFTLVGSYKAEPTITFTIDDGDNLTTIKLENETNDDWIQVTKTALPSDVFVDADQLIIDCNNETVQILRSGTYTDVDFTGIFPQLDVGSNTLEITLTKSGAVQVDASLTYYPTYL